MDSFNQNKIVSNLADVMDVLSEEMNRLNVLYQDVNTEYIHLSYDDFQSDYGRKLQSEVFKYRDAIYKIENQLSELDKILGEYSW